jgi:hypothetical protein
MLLFSLFSLLLQMKQTVSDCGSKSAVISLLTWYW